MHGGGYGQASAISHRLSTELPKEFNSSAQDDAADKQRTDVNDSIDCGANNAYLHSFMFGTRKSAVPQNGTLAMEDGRSVGRVERSGKQGLKFYCDNILDAVGHCIRSKPHECDGTRTSAITATARASGFAFPLIGCLITDTVLHARMSHVRTVIYLLICRHANSHRGGSCHARVRRLGTHTLAHGRTNHRRHTGDRYGKH